MFTRIVHHANCMYIRTCIAVEQMLEESRDIIEGERESKKEMVTGSDGGTVEGG